MTCFSCVEKLAIKLMSHHKIDVIRAYELAEKAVERVAKNRPPDLPHPLDDPTDYTQACSPCVPAGDCFNDEYCAVAADCNAGWDCYPVCPAPSKANSHLEGSTCACAKTGGTCGCQLHVCIGSIGTCASPTGLCNYHCDAGYVWNPVTLTCDVVAGGQQLSTLINQEDY